MIDFSFSRFVNVARWDLTFNRKYYLRMGLTIMVVTAIPVLTNILGMVATKLGITQYMLINVDDMIPFEVSFFFAFILVMLGRTFHNLKNKGSRLNELMLPASNSEKFLWHVLFYLIAPILVFLLGILLSDMINAAFVGLMVGGDSLESLTLSLLEHESGGLKVSIEGLQGTITLCRFRMLQMGVLLMLLSFYSTFVLGNAWKYRHNILQTLLLHIAVWLLFAFVVGVCVQYLDGWLPEDVFENKPYMLTILLCCFDAFFLLFLAGIWALSYRLYSRAQITTRRNP